MLINVLIVLGALVILLVLVIANRPSDFRITRTALIAAPLAVVFAHVNDLRQWQDWSPWAKMDPNAKTTYEGPPEGIGAIMHWAGNRKVGAGNMTILESHRDIIRIRLQCSGNRFPVSIRLSLLFKPQGDQTAVSWSMWGTNNFMAKAFNLVINLATRWCGGQFEQGLASLNAVASARRS